METKRNRLPYIDNLRLLVIISIVILHLSSSYSGAGMWYWMEGRPIKLISLIVFLTFHLFTQGYSMGLLFLVAGYFVPGAYDRKGFGKFITDRLVRLGIPSLLYMLVINPFIWYAQVDLFGLTPKPDFFTFYITYLRKLDFLHNAGPLWFALALLVFSIIYGLVRLAFPRRLPIRHHEAKPSFFKWLCLILLIAMGAFALRLWQPIGAIVFSMQFCFFSQYVILFIVGLWAYRSRLLDKIEYKTGKWWLYSGLVLGIGGFIWLLYAGGILAGYPFFKGGLYWQAAVYALWESFVAIAMSIGLIAVFREKCNRQDRLVKVLSDNSFAVYVFHAPVIVALAQWMHPVALPPFAKFAILCVVSLAVCFAFTYFIVRRVPLLKKVM